MIEILHTDCTEFMEAQPANAFGLLSADPVYGINGNSHRKNKSRGKLARSKDYHPALWDQKMPDDKYFAEAFRVSHHQFIFGGNYYPQLGLPFKTPRRSEIDQFLKDHPFGWIAWDKCNGTTGFNDYELIWTSFNHMPSFVYKFMWNGFMQGMSVEKGHLQQPLKKYNEVRIHPTQKPVAIYKFLFKAFKDWAAIGGGILDTNGGSMSSALAANEMGFNMVVCEIDETYYNAACKRFKEQTAQLSLL